MLAKLYQKVKLWWIILILRITPTCKDITRLLSDSMDRNLSLRQRIDIKLHLIMCVWCERYKRQLLFLRDALRHSLAYIEETGVSPTPSLPPEARERIKRALSGKGE